jgi:acetate kinase
MDQAAAHLLVINAGSSSIKFSVYRTEAPPVRSYRGCIERIGIAGTALTVDGSARLGLGNLDAEAAASFLIDWLEEHFGLASFAAVGHRIVHGGPGAREDSLVTEEMLVDLRRIVGYAPEHLPLEIGLIESIRRRAPALPQLACFDTSFHRDIPAIARLLAIPRRYQRLGVQRYGFHGLSYAYLMKELSRLAGIRVALGRVILAHLGNGSSLAAVSGGKSIDTTMGFTPAAGVMMSTRSGDLDPGLVGYLARTEGMTAEQFDRMVNHESGLLGISETSADMRDLLERETDDPRAAEAVALFCYQVKKGIGALAAALGGVDAIVFTGGIGENAPAVRARICDGLGFLGVQLDAGRNLAGDAVISLALSRVVVRVIPTDEEGMIAKAVIQALA